MTVPLKVVYGQDIRRYAPATQATYTQLVNFVQTNFGLQDFILKYHDDENDRVTISSQAELEEGLQIAADDDPPRKSLKIFVMTAFQAEPNVVEEKKIVKKAQKSPVAVADKKLAKKMKKMKKTKKNITKALKKAEKRLRRAEQREAGSQGFVVLWRSEGRFSEARFSNCQQALRQEKSLVGKSRFVIDLQDSSVIASWYKSPTDESLLFGAARKHGLLPSVKPTLRLELVSPAGQGLIMGSRFELHRGLINGRGIHLALGPASQAIELVWDDKILRMAGEPALSLDVAFKKNVEGNTLSLWCNEDHPEWTQNFQLNDDGTISPDGTPSLVLGWASCYRYQLAGRKALVLVKRHASTQLAFKVTGSNVKVVTAREHTSQTIQVPGGAAAVRRAFYGDPRKLWDTSRGAFVTDKVKEILRDGGVLRAKNQHFGDPLYGVVKVLAVEFEPVQWKRHVDSYLSGYAGGKKQAFGTLEEAQRACLKMDAAECAGITLEACEYTLRSRSKVYPSPSGEISWIRPASSEALPTPGHQVTGSNFEVATAREHTSQTISVAGGAAAVRRAFYGDPGNLWDTSHGALVTDKVKEILRDGGVLRAKNQYFGDPLYGVVKVLAVEFEPVQWKRHANSYLSGYAGGKKHAFSTLEEAQRACLKMSVADCAGVTLEAGEYTLRSRPKVYPSPSGETTWIRPATSEKPPTSEHQMSGCCKKGGHTLKVFQTPSPNWWCSGCGPSLRFPEGTTLWGCRVCDEDYCVKCISIRAADSDRPTPFRAVSSSGLKELVFTGYRWNTRAGPGKTFKYVRRGLRRGTTVVAMTSQPYERGEGAWVQIAEGEWIGTHWNGKAFWDISTTDLKHVTGLPVGEPSYAFGAVCDHSGTKLDTLSEGYYHSKSTSFDTCAEFLNARYVVANASVAAVNGVYSRRALPTYRGPPTYCRDNSEIYMFRWARTQWCVVDRSSGGALPGKILYITASTSSTPPTRGWLAVGGGADLPRVSLYRSKSSTLIGPDYHGLFKSFVNSTAVKSALPKAVQVAFLVLNDGGSLVDAIEQVLLACPVIARHPLLIAVRPRLPMILKKVSGWVPTLKSLGPDFVVTVLPLIFESLPKHFNSSGPINLDLDITKLAARLTSPVSSDSSCLDPDRSLSPSPPQAVPESKDPVTEGDTRLRAFRAGVAFASWFQLRRPNGGDWAIAQCVEEDFAKDLLLVRYESRSGRPREEWLSRQSPRIMPIQNLPKVLTRDMVERLRKLGPTPDEEANTPEPNAPQPYDDLPSTQDNTLESTALPEPKATLLDALSPQPSPMASLSPSTVDALANEPTLLESLPDEPSPMSALPAQSSLLDAVRSSQPPLYSEEEEALVDAVVSAMSASGSVLANAAPADGSPSAVLASSSTDGASKLLVPPLSRSSSEESLSFSPMDTVSVSSENSFVTVDAGAKPTSPEPPALVCSPQVTATSAGTRLLQMRSSVVPPSPSSPTEEIETLQQQLKKLDSAITEREKAVSASSPAQVDSPIPTSTAAVPGKFATQLATLADMGFKDSELNSFLLEKHGGDCAEVVARLVGNVGGFELV